MAADCTGFARWHVLFAHELGGSWLRAQQFEAQTACVLRLPVAVIWHVCLLTCRRCSTALA